MTQRAISRDVVPGSPNHPAWLAVGLLALGTLALVTSEFLPASLLSRMGQDLDVSQGSAGQTVTATALMGAIVAPTISIVTRRLDRRFVIWGLTTLLVVSNGLVCATTNFWMTLLARLLLGIAGLKHHKFILCVISQPTATHPRESPVENTILHNADNHLPSTIKLYVCRLNDENVVNPPQIPTTSNC